MEDLGGQNIGFVFGDILRDIQLLWNQGGMEDRDISTDIILVLEDSFRGCLVNYDCASCYSTSAAPDRNLERTGTRDTMAITLLRDQKGFIHRPIHDVESLVYTFWKVTTIFMNCLFERNQYRRTEEGRGWNFFFASLKWNDSSISDKDLVSARHIMWQEMTLTEFCGWIKLLAEGNRVDCRHITKFVMDLEKLRIAGAIDVLHGMEEIEPGTKKDEEGLDEESSDEEDADKVDPKRSRQEVTDEMYLKVTVKLGKMLQKLEDKGDQFLDLICREHGKLSVY